MMSTIIKPRCIELTLLSDARAGHPETRALERFLESIGMMATSWLSTVPD
eukprot:m.132593 g.132593  ORF g.132593 m.132593 type:complete len:50 (-) comp15931_c0_seq10:7-156(-)